MKSIEELLNDVIKREGGYVNHPNDKGGPTKYGITQRTLSAYLGRAASIEDVKNLDIALAKEIYQRNYYFKPRINALPAMLQPIMFDMMVLHSPKVVWRILQEIINEAGFGPVDEDGVSGPQTFNAAETCAVEMGDYLINAIVDARIEFYKMRVEKDPSQKVFLKGWCNRAEHFRVAV
jgi:lysozyme family protein